jgi:hypothetical protein
MERANTILQSFNLAVRFQSRWRKRHRGLCPHLHTEAAQTVKNRVYSKLWIIYVNGVSLIHDKAHFETEVRDEGSVGQSISRCCETLGQAQYSSCCSLQFYVTITILHWRCKQQRSLLVTYTILPSTRQVEVKVTLRLTVSQSVSLGVEPHLELMTRYLLLFGSYGLVFCGVPSLTRGRVCLLYMLLALASVAFLGSESLFYSLRFETSLFVASYDSQGHGGGIRPRLHTGKSTQQYSIIYLYSTHYMFRLQTGHLQVLQVSDIPLPNCNANISIFINRSYKLVPIQFTH